ncbi:MAG: hypothetical protein WC043_02740 [Pseudobdellovibrionaceae bacterium]
MSFPRSFLALSCSALVLASCSFWSEHPVIINDIVKRIAAPVFMLERDIPGGKFIIQAQERIYQRGEPVTLYIEGDGFLYTTPAAADGDPTPTDPLALRLAAQDGGPNVIWLARPCQYNKGWKDGKECPSAYWTTHRFAPEVIDVYNQALDNIKATYGTPSFDLVGYDGGATLAVMLASQRSDITSLRTVAGNLEPRLVASILKAPYSEEGLNPIDFAAGVGAIPQRHFIGKNDFVTPPAVYNSFAQAVGNGSCMNVSLVDNASHDAGWVEQWAVLKGLPIDCAQPAEPQPVVFDPTPLDGDKYKRAK